jgi:ribosomal protein L11 methylase PrmA
MLIRAADRIQQFVKPGGILIMSGLQTEERDEVWRAFAGFQLEGEASEDGWITFTARKRSNH